MAVHQIEIEINPGQVGQRLDQFLAIHFPQYSRAYLQKQIAANQILLNNRAAHKGDLLRIHDKIQVIEIREEHERLPSANPDLEMNAWFEDEFLAVIEKPAGVPTHPVNHEETATVVNWWIAKNPILLCGGEEPLRPGVVHRLDTGTSGLLILAKSTEIRAALQDQFRQRLVKKEYTALVFGVTPPSGTVNFPLAHDPKSKRRMMAVRNSWDTEKLKARTAITEYQLIEAFTDFSLLLVKTKTGRMHQVRVHLTAIGHPLVGDRVYTKRNWTKAPPPPIARHCLHASRISFTHPKTGQELDLHSPLPADMAQAVSHLRARMKD